MAMTIPGPELQSDLNGRWYRWVVAPVSGCSDLYQLLLGSSSGDCGEVSAELLVLGGEFVSSCLVEIIGRCDLSATKSCI